MEGKEGQQNGETHCRCVGHGRNKGHPPTLSFTPHLHSGCDENTVAKKGGGQWVQGGRHVVCAAQCVVQCDADQCIQV